MNKMKTTFKSLLATTGLLLTFNLQSCSNTPEEIDTSPTATFHVTAGNLSSLVGNRKEFITDLTLTGSLNGDDIRCIHEMTGYRNQKPIGKLSILNLADANIVRGGDYYVDGGINYRPHTTDNVIGESMFNYLNLVSIILPNNVTSIGTIAFQDCRGLTEITIPNRVTSIGDRAFEDCVRLTEITIPNSVTSIGYSAFENCRDLTSVTIGNGVTSIKSMTFINTRLYEITIPSNVASIGSSAFGSMAVGVIHCQRATPPNLIWEPYSVNVDPFISKDKTNYALYVPIGSSAAYKASVYWSQFSKIFEE